MSAELDEIYRPPRPESGRDEPKLLAKLVGYKSCSILAWFVAGLVGVNALLLMLNIVLGAYGVLHTEELMTGRVLPEGLALLEEASAQEATRLALRATAIVAFFIWLYRLHANIPALGKRTTVTPAGAVIHYFIPFLNLFRPYQHMMVAWRLSSPSKKQRDAPSSIGWWWAACIGWWVTSSLSGVFLRPGVVAAPTVEGFQRLGVVQIAFNVLALVAAGLCIHMVLALSARQERAAVRRAERLRKR